MNKSFGMTITAWYLASYPLHITLNSMIYFGIVLSSLFVVKSGTSVGVTFNYTFFSIKNSLNLKTQEQFWNLLESAHHEDSKIVLVFWCHKVNNAHRISLEQVFLSMYLSQIWQ